MGLARGFVAALFLSSGLFACSDWLLDAREYNTLTEQLQSLREYTEGSPLVLAVYPDRTTAVVRPSTPIQITFNVPMDRASTESALEVLAGSDPVSGDLEWGTGDQIATFRPDSPFVAGTEVSVSVDQEARSALDVGMLDVWSTRFTISDVGADTEAPRIVSVTPSIGPNEVADLTNVPVTAYVGVSFSEAMDTQTSSGAFVLQDDAFQTVSGTQTWITPEYLEFVPTDGLEFSRNYQIRIGTGARDLEGNTLEVPFQKVFTTASEADVNPPAVIETSPEDGATETSLASAVTLQFNEQMDRTSTQGSFALFRGSTAVSGTFGWSANSLTFTPAESLAPDEEYRVSLSTTATDISGNSLAQAFESTFRTTASAAVDTTPPTVVSTLPEGDAIDVDLEPTLTVTFSEPVTVSSVAAGVTLRQSGQLVPVTYSGLSGNTASFTPTGALGSDTEYQLRIGTSVRDLSGNALANAVTRSFTSEAPGIDLVPPGPVTNFTASVADASSNLSWINPVDVDFDGVAIRQSTDSFPATATDGDSVCNPCMSSQPVAGLSNGAQYFFSAFAFDTSGNFSIAAQASVTPAALTPATIDEIIVGFDGTCQPELTVAWTGGGSDLEIRTGPAQGIATHMGLTSPATITGLTGGQSYTIAVVGTTAERAIDLPIDTRDVDVIISEMCEPQTNFREDNFFELSNLENFGIDLSGYRLIVRVNSGLGNFSPSAQSNVDIDTSDGSFRYTINVQNPVLGSNESRILLDDEASWANVSSDWIIQVPDQAGNFATTQEWFNWNGQRRDGVQIEDACGNLIDTSWADPTSGDATSFFANGYATRNGSVTGPSNTFNLSEWITGAAATYNDCSPRVHPAP